MRAWSRTAVVCLVFTQGCTDPENWLEGSLTEAYDLHFDSVRARLYPTMLSVEYLDSSLGDAVSLRVTADVDALSTTEPIDLLAAGTLGRGDVHASRLPELEEGTLWLTAHRFHEGSRVDGTLHAVVATSHDDRLTVRGGFVADLELVGP